MAIPTLPHDRLATFQEYTTWYQQVHGRPATQADYQTYMQMRQNALPVDTSQLGQIPNNVNGPLSNGRPQTPALGYQQGPDFGFGGQPQGTSLDLGGVGGAIWGGIKDIGKWILNNPEIIPIGLGAINAAKDSGKASDLQNAMLSRATAKDAELAPLRQLAMQKAQAPMPTAPDLAPLFRKNNPNPFA